MCKNILLSIKPIYMAEILKGNKIIELRKKIGKDFLPETKIYLYASSPVKSLVGTATLKNIQKLAVEQALHKKYDIFNTACISQKDFNEYFASCEFCYFLYLQRVEQYKIPINLISLRKLGVTPPQSFCYLNEEQTKKIDGLLEVI